MRFKNHLRSPDQVAIAPCTDPIQVRFQLLEAKLQVKGVTMKFLRFLTSLLLACALLLSASSVYSLSVLIAAQKERSAHSKQPAKFHYVCPMHEDVTFKKSGLCPKCKMKLVKKPVVQEPTTSSS